MAEWSNAPVLKTGKDASPSRVRIPVSLRHYLEALEFLLLRTFNSLILILTFTPKKIVCPGGGKILRFIHILNSKSQPIIRTIKFRNAIIAGAT